ncbi:MAG: fibrobacter succinogenes major paralogous domain-containing protein [Prevotellaceae bacterium]|jgi:uncharacterized protein (TIGR02145 family)|nr:fibrobacter succinogenes major paralogous domain-containing protein [Prevotellaceae bacterium]
MKTKMLLITLLIGVLSSCAFLKKNTATRDKGVEINGVRWATCNVDVPGSFAATPESAGKFYQWNRKTAWNTTDKKVENWDNTTPEGSKWTKANDPSPKGWCIPTRDELESLLDTAKVNRTWDDKKKAYIFTDKANGNSLFLPAVGFRSYSDGTRCYAGMFGYYWSSMQYDSFGAYHAYHLYFDSHHADCKNSHCAVGQSVRPVAE